MHVHVLTDCQPFRANFEGSLCVEGVGIGRFRPRIRRLLEPRVMVRWNGRKVRVLCRLQEMVAR